MFFYFKKLLQHYFQKKVYLDYASTTPIDNRVLSVMNTVYRTSYGNAGSLYTLGTTTEQFIYDARKKIAKIIGAQSSQIIFTRGGTESDNLAILGVVNKFKQNFPDRIPHIITSTIEHDAVLETCRYLEKNQQATVTYIGCDSNGIISLDEIKKSLTQDTILVTIMYANNEIGTIQPIREITKLIRWYKKHHKEENVLYPLVHTDAIQSVNYLDSNVQRLGVDLMSFSGSKIYGPKSSGILFVKNREIIAPIMFGGKQEFALRAGTEDVASIAGFAKALEISSQEQEGEFARLSTLQNWFIKELQKDTRIVVNGSIENRLPNNINITVAGFSGEQLVIQLDAKGFAVSAKSACQSKSDEESHVIRALRIAQGRQLGNTEEGSLRMSLGRKTIKKDLQNFLKVFWQIVQ